VHRLRDRVTSSPRSWSGVWLVIRLAGFMILLHLVEIAAWGLVYVWRGAMPDVPSALYFSAVTYTTTGYGDLVLPPDWRLVGAIEALTGILMCGLSTGFFFAVLSRMVRDESAPGG
jgi:voltage-gated potassium channel Kch